MTLNNETFKELNGEFVFDSTHQKYFLKRFSNDTFNIDIFKIKLTTLSERTINVQYIKNDSILKSYELQGRLKKNGYFKIRTKLSTNFIFGPLVWGLGQNCRAIGLTKDNDLVLITDSGGTLFVLFIPLGASSVQIESEFKRNN